jgi:hypothetical protein
MNSGEPADDDGGMAFFGEVPVVHQEAVFRILPMLEAEHTAMVIRGKGRTALTHRTPP